MPGPRYDKLLPLLRLEMHVAEQHALAFVISVLKPRWEDLLNRVFSLRNYIPHPAAELSDRWDCPLAIPFRYAAVGQEFAHLAGRGPCHFPS